MQEELHRKSVEVRMTIRIMSSPQGTKLMVAEKWTATSCCCAYVSRKGAGLSFTASKLSSIPNVSAPLPALRHVEQEPQKSCKRLY